MKFADVTIATPAEIDTEIARLTGIIVRANQAIDAAKDFLARRENAADWEREGYPWFSQEKADQAVATIESNTVTKRLAAEAEAPLHAEYVRRGWNRYWLVTNTGGHVHSSTGCDTCYPTTRFAWLTDHSGMPTEDLVELAGEQACTVCFPDAPVDTLRRKSRIETPERKAKREEREAKAAAKAEAEVRVENYVGYGGRVQTKVFKSVRGATNEIASNLGDLAWYGTTHPSATEWLANTEAIRKALAEKGVEYDYEKALANARKKVTKEGMKPKF